MRERSPIATQPTPAERTRAGRMLAALMPLCLVWALCLCPGTANAGIPVIDRTAIANLIQQIGYWQQQLASMTQQLTQMRQTYASVTGTRGMQNLLPVTPQQRNYLPPDYAELMNTINGQSTTYAGLSGRIQAAVAANAVLTNAQLQTMSPEQRQIVENGRRAAAAAATLSQAAYQNTGQRFNVMQQLITMIGNAPDLKAIEDLQGRIGAEQTMLTNEQIKLQTLGQVLQADQMVQEARIRERVIANHGGFDSRFTPVP